MDAVRTYLARLENLLAADVTLTPDAVHPIDDPADLPTFLSVDAVLRHGELVEWSLNFDPSSRRSRLAPGHVPLLGSELLEDLMHQGRLAHLEERVQRETIGLRGQAVVGSSFQNGFLWKPSWEDGVQPGVFEVKVRDLLTVSSRTVLLGPLGSGKSTVMRALAREQAAAWLDSGGQRAPLPLYVEVRRLAIFMADHLRTARTMTLDALLGHVADSSEVPRALVDEALRAWQDGRAALLLDGLDEIYAALPRQAADRVERALLGVFTGWSHRPTTSSVLISSRPRADMPAELRGFLPVEIAPLTRHEAVEIVTRHRQLPEHDKQRVQRVLASTPAELHSRPLFVVLVGGLLSGDALPSSLSRASVLDAALHQLTVDRAVAKSGQRELIDYIGCDEATLLQGLERLAYESLPSGAGAGSLGPPTGGIALRGGSTGPGTRGAAPVLRVGRVAEVFLALSDNIRINTLMTALLRDSGLLVDHGEELAFVHRAFQDTLAAGHLLQLTKKDRSHAALLDRLLPADEVMRDVAVLYIAKARTRGSVNMLLDLCSAALDRAESGPTNQDRGRFVWLAAIVLRALRSLPDVGRSRRDTVVLDAFRAAAPLYVGDCEALPLRDRVSVAEQLGWWSDPRPGVGLDAKGRPLLQWVPIPGGTYVVGLDEELSARVRREGGERVSREGPPAHVALEPFDMAFHPVTWQQFRAFVDAPEGYLAQHWWLPAAPGHDSSVRNARARGTEPSH